MILAGIARQAAKKEVNLLFRIPARADVLSGNANVQIAQAVDIGEALLMIGKVWGSHSVTGRENRVEVYPLPPDMSSRAVKRTARDPAPVLFVHLHHTTREMRHRNASQNARLQVARHGCRGFH